MPADTNIQIPIDSDLKERFRKAAKAGDRKMADQCRLLIKHFVSTAEAGNNPPASAGSLAVAASS